MREQTLSIIKPDGVAKNLIGTVIKRIEEEGLQIMAVKMIKMTKEQAKGFYKVHEDKPFYESNRFYVFWAICSYDAGWGRDYKKISKVNGRYEL